MWGSLQLLPLAISCGSLFSPEPKPTARLGVSPEAACQGPGRVHSSGVLWSPLLLWMVPSRLPLSWVFFQAEFGTVSAHPKGNKGTHQTGSNTCYPLTNPWEKRYRFKMISEGFPGGAVVENLPANAEDMGSNPGLEDPTCHGATRPVSHNYWACVSGACAPQQERPR